MGGVGSGVRRWATETRGCTASGPRGHPPRNCGRAPRMEGRAPRAAPAMGGDRSRTDAQTGMLPGMPESAMCVQRFDDSLNSAIHITYRISLRSSSMREPRDPLLKVLTCFFSFLDVRYRLFGRREPDRSREGPGEQAQFTQFTGGLVIFSSARTIAGSGVVSNDPSAGSPTETLLRLLLPLNDQV